MRESKILLVLGLLLIAGLPLVGNVDAIANTNAPTANTGTGLSNPTNGYASDNNYASDTILPTTSNLHFYHGYGFENMGSEITTVEVGVEQYMNRTEVYSTISVSTDGGTTYSSQIYTTTKTSDNDVIEWIDVTSSIDGWDDLSDTNFRVRIIYGCSVYGTFYLDYIPVRVTHSGVLNIEIRNPQNGQEVYNTIDLVSYVDTDDTVDEVTYRISGDSSWFKATYNSKSNTYIYKTFDTRNYASGSFYTITARVNLTDGRYTTDTVSIYINNQNQDCVQDENGNWICKSGKTYPGDKSKGTLDGTLVDPFYVLLFSVEGSGTGTSVNFEDARISTSDTVIEDELHVSNYDYSNRVWYNTSSTILVNTTYLTFYDGGGGQETWVNSSVSLTAYRDVLIRRVRGFNWTFDSDTRIYIYSLLITNSLSYTMNVELLYVGVAPDTYADPKSVTVRDVTNSDDLENGQDYGSDFAGFYLTFRGLTSGSTRQFTFSYMDFVEGTDILKPIITVTTTDVESEPVTRNTHSYSRAKKSAYNSNNWDYTGIVIVHWQIPNTDFQSLIIEDSEGSVYEWYIEQGQVIIKDVQMDEHTNKEFYFYFDYKSTDAIAWASFFLPFIILFLLILSTVCGIMLIKKDMDVDKKKFVVFVGLGSFFFALVLIFIVYILPALS